MNYIPQEAKEQIASLMSDIEKLELLKSQLIKEKIVLNRVVDNKKNAISILSGSLALVIMGMVAMFVFGGGFSDKNNSTTLKTKITALSKQNKTYKSKISSLSNLIANSSNQAESVEESNIESFNNTETDLVYRVQIGAFRNFRLGFSDSRKNGVVEEIEGGFNKYQIGIFSKYREALRFKKELKKMGLRKAFLVAEYEGEKLNVDRAIEIEESTK